MHEGFMQVVSNAYGEAGAPAPDMSKYRHFSTAVEFHTAHWSERGFAEAKPAGAANASKWLRNLGTARRSRVRFMS